MHPAPIPPKSRATHTLLALLGPVLVGILLVACAPPDPAHDDPPSPVYDLILHGGQVVDGSGEPAFTADVGIRGDRIVRVAPEGLDPADSRESWDVSGRVVAPGFVDNHAHIQLTVAQRPLLENFIRQGITSILATQHSLDQPWPLDEFTDELRMAPNVGFFAGHTWIRKQVLGLDDRPPSEAELEEMKRYVEESMEAGALGLSTGLQYAPAAYAETEEVIDLARVASRHGGIYSSHMRDEGRGLLSSVRELVRIADEADIPAQIQHHKAFGPGQWGWSRESLALVDSARSAGLDVKHDLYPYDAASTGSSVLFPSWALAGGPDSLAARLDRPEVRTRIEEEMRESWTREWTGDDLSRIQFRTVSALPEYDGRTLADLARDRGLPNTVDAGIPLVIELQLQGGFSAIYHAMDEEDVIRIMRHPWAMFETDGDAVGHGIGFPHPRSYGSFPRILSRYVRELEVLSLEEAVRKMSRLPSVQVGQEERGLVREGHYADLVVFDPERVEDRATFTDPHQYSSGIHHVVVNGVPVIRDGSLTGEMPGRVLEGPARPGTAGES